MVRTKCCNPFAKLNHNKYRKDIRLVTETLQKKYSNLEASKYICSNCRLKCNRLPESETFNILVDEKPVAFSSNIVPLEPSDNDTDCESINEYVAKCGDKSMITESLNKTLNILNQSPITSIHFSSRDNAVQKLNYMQKTVKRKLIDNFSDDDSDYFSQEVLPELREKYSKLTNYDNQLHLLTILPQ